MTTWATLYERSVALGHNRIRTEQIIRRARMRALGGDYGCDPGEPRRGNDTDAGNQGRPVRVGPLSNSAARSNIAAWRRRLLAWLAR
jgi:hypothetical protein